MNMNPFISLISSVLSLYSFLLVIWIGMSWLIAFNIVNPNQVLVHRIMYVLSRLIEPVLRKIRAFIPPIASIDLSPIIVFLLIQFINNAMYTYLYTPQF